MKEKIGKYRYRILALLFMATTINYLDRSIIGVLAPILQNKVFDWSETDYSNIVMAFMFAYAFGLVFMGNLIDRFGAKIGYTISITVWSIFGMLHAAVRPAFGLIGFIIARTGLGVGEAGNFPAAIKTVAEWFPKKERAFATGIFNAGANIGAILAPIMIPLVVMADGTNWQYAFLVTGFFSALWVFLWWRTYKKPEEHPKLSKAELEYINSDSIQETEERISWWKLLPLKQTWAFAAGKTTDAVWWFYLFWGAKYFSAKFGLDIKSVAIPLMIIYLIADIGSILGGYLSTYFIKKGWTLNKARKMSMLICVFAILPIVLIPQIPTTFKVDQKLFSELSSTQYKKKTEVNINGKLKNKKINLDFPAHAVEAIKVLEGNEYSSAKEFDADLLKVIDKDELISLESTIHNNSRTDNYYWIAVLLIALAAAGHTAWMANLFTLVSDVFPKKATASVTGIGGMVGALTGAAAAFTLGHVLESSGASGYFFAFLIVGAMYPILLTLIHVLMPNLTPLGDDLKPIKSN